MEIFKRYFKGMRLLVTSISLLLIVLGTALLIAIEVPIIQNYLNDTWEVQTSEVVPGEIEGQTYYESDYATALEAQQAGRDLNEQIAEEGFVLVKNDNNALPLATTNGLSVFGYVATHIISGGTGSGGSGIDDTTLLENSLTNAGFSINEDLYNFYENESLYTDGAGYAASAMDSDPNGIQFKVGEVQIGDLPASIESTYDTYNTALYVIGRIGGEGADLPRSFSADSAQVAYDSRDLGKNALELTAAEIDTLDYLQANFDNIIVIINSSAAMELGFLENYSHVNAAIITAGTGENGINALGRVLNGEVNPSGRLVDTYVYDVFSNPANLNFGSYAYNNVDINAYDGHYVEYEEGIYVGYYYYETRGYTDGESWYNDTVQYPFGYGLSYTTFDYEVVGTPGGNINSDDYIEIEVTVTNTGDVAGKEVVQLYYSAPYTNGEIEKPYVKLGAFGKTQLLQPGQSQTLTLRMVADSMASYDDTDANNNGFAGYELEAGNYELSVRTDAHTVVNDLAFEYTVTRDYELVDSISFGTGVENQFDNITAEMSTVLSRSDWEGTWPTTPVGEVAAPSWVVSLINDPGQVIESDYDTPFLFGQTLENKITFVMMRDIAYDNDQVWDQFISQLSYEEALTLLGESAYSTRPIESIAKPETADLDGPVGLQTSFMGNAPGLLTVAFASEVLIAQTWNVDLSAEMGSSMGSIALNYDGIISGWYAPALNTHRSQFAGRNFEYYSEDPILSGEMAAAATSAAKAKGLYVYLKHYALNDQETHRLGISTWFTEQSAREVYLRGFGIAVREGGAQAMMSAFNRLGGMWAGSSKELLTNILRDEWGFEGMVKTDFVYMGDNNYNDHDTMLYAGGDVLLYLASINLEDENSAQTTIFVKNAVKNILFTTVNSNAVNGLSADSQIVIYKPIQWAWYAGFLSLSIVLIAGSIGALGYNGYLINKELKHLNK